MFANQSQYMESVQSILTVVVRDNGKSIGNDTTSMNEEATLSKNSDKLISE